MKKPLRLLLDARMLIGRFSGISRYVTRLAEQLSKNKEIQVVALCGQQVPDIWVSNPKIETLTTPFTKGDRAPDKRYVWEKKHLRNILKDANVDIYHATWNSGIPSFCPVPSVLTIHDLIPWHDPDLYFATTRQFKAYKHSTRAAARRATSVIGVSHFARKDVLRNLRIKEQKIVVIHNGVDFPKDESISFNADQTPYVLYVGGHQQRKNVETVFKVMQHYWLEYEPKLELRLTGNIQSLTPLAREAFHQLSNPEKIHFLGDIDDQELSRQYASARCLLMLSRNEGFGLPVLEAMAHGCPVIASNLTSLPEVVEDAGILVHPDDFTGAAQALNKLFTHHHLWTDLVQKGRNRVLSFGWNLVAEKTLKLYNNIVRANQPAHTDLAAQNA